MSLESSLARVAELHAWLSAPGPSTQTQQPAALPGAASAATGTFADALAQAGSTLSPAPGNGSYPHLRGDLDANPELLARLERLATKRNETWTITSGGRTFAEQQRLWDQRASNPFPVAQPGTSRHESRNAADVFVGGRPIQEVIPRAELVAAGLAPLAGDAVHIDLPT